MKVSSISIFKKDELIDKIFKNKKCIDHPIKFIKSSGNYLIETEEFSGNKINKESKIKTIDLQQGIFLIRDMRRLYYIIQN